VLTRPLLLVFAVTVLVGVRVGAVHAPALHSSAQVPDWCPVTLAPETPWVPPAPYPAQAPGADRFWFGDDALWTMPRRDGTWRGIPPDLGFGRGYRDKSFWWRAGYHGPSEPVPWLTVTGRRLDRDAPLYHPDAATNAHHVDFGGWAMLVGLDIPTSGCWELTGRYGNASVTYVVWVVE
jgi:hypothetical protein